MIMSLKWLYAIICSSKEQTGKGFWDSSYARTLDERLTLYQFQMIMKDGKKGGKQKAHQRWALSDTIRSNQDEGTSLIFSLTNRIVSPHVLFCQHSDNVDYLVWRRWLNWFSETYVSANCTLLLQKHWPCAEWVSGCSMNFLQYGHQCSIMSIAQTLARFLPRNLQQWGVKSITTNVFILFFGETATFSEAGLTNGFRNY